MTFAPYGPIDISSLYIDLELLNLQETFQLERGKFMYKRKKELLPITIANYFTHAQQTEHSYNLRRRENSSTIFQSNTMFAKKSIQNEGEILWRSLLPCLKDLDSIIAFKKYYKSHLLNPQ